MSNTAEQTEKKLKKNPNEKIFLITLKKSEHEKLKAVAKQDGRSVKAQVRHYVLEMLKNV